MIKICAILTGKKNSSLKNKNIVKIFNQRVFMYPATEATKVKAIKYFYTSSDSNVILKETKKIGYHSIKRPAHLSTSKSKHIDVLRHAVNYIKKRIEKPDILVILMANSPTIKSQWISKAINVLIKKKASAVVPVIKNNDHHPLRAKKIVRGFIKSHFKKKIKVSSNRQDLTNNYFLCHNFWIITTDSLIKNDGFAPWKFMGKKVVPFIIDESTDIHRKEDILNCKMWIKKNLF
jgi:CMP-N-acetylneuraminic acid synthetase